MPPTTSVVGSRVVAERLDDRTGGGAVAGAADDALLFRFVDNNVSRRVGGDDGVDDECEAFSLGVDEIVAFGAVAQPAFEEAAGGTRLVGGDAAQAAAACGPAAGLIGGEHRLQLAAKHQANVSTVESNFDLDTPTTERLFESLWPAVSELDDTVAPASWSEDDFDLLFPDLA